MGNIYYRDTSGYGARPPYGARPRYGERNSYESPRQRREREEAEFLRRMEEAKNKPVNAEKASGPQTVTVDLDKRMGILERKAHARMSEIYRAAAEYIEKGEDNLKRLKIICEQFDADHPNHFSAPAKSYIASNSHKIFGSNSKKEVQNLAQKMLDTRRDLEVKNILKIHQANDPENTVAQYLKDKSPEERFHSIKSMLGAFKNSPKPEYQEAFNKILAPYGYKIVKIENRETPLEARQVVRAAFDGNLKIPTEEDTQKGVGYSQGYQDFLSGKIKSGSPAKYNFDTKLFKALEMCDNTEKLGSPIREAIRKQRLPQEVVDNLSLSDAAHLLHQSRYPHRSPQPEETISFQAIDPNRDEGLRNQFWKGIATDKAKTRVLQETLAKKGVSKEYIAFMMESIRENGVPNPTIPDDMHFDGPIPTISLHHKFYIRDAAFHKDMMKVDDEQNYEIVIDYPKQKTHEELKHGADCTTPDGKYAYRLVYADDGAGRDAFISDGLETITTPTQDTNRLTYNRLSQKGDRE